MSRDEIEELQRLQAKEMRDLLSPKPLSKKRREIRVQTWRELAEMMAA